MYNGLVSHTGEKVRTRVPGGVEISFKNQLNFDQYNEQHGGTLEKAGEDDFFKMLHKWENQNLCSQFEEITEDQWDDFLCCLPPLNWHNFENLNIFFMGEPYSFLIYKCCIKDMETGKYYSAYRRIDETDQQLKEIFYKALAG
ncbi:hypothetical protein [uncultured Chryseobacterium sp.]|uniref:hypothetical protein n=1 Tax=uncultured Chryseobacterium sp. TaxID=259322 RepID=UPI002601037F|nr:hypothetical protein [uncultured Chryseobacterium sp.]